MEVAMTRLLALALAAVLAFGTAAPAFAQSATLDKISQSGTLVIGTRTGSPPFAYVNKDNQWVGFSIDPAQQGSTNARIIREKAPSAQLREFPDQPAAFQVLVQGQVDAYTNDGIQLAGLKAKAPKPDDWVIAGDFFSYEPYGMAMRKNDSDFRAVVNNGLMEAIESGKYFELYDKWFGPKGEVPYPLTPENKRFLQLQVVPK